MADEYLTPKQAAELIPGMTVSNLAQLRFTGRGPKYLKPGGERSRLIVYRKSDCIEWLEASERTSTAAVK